MTGNGRGPGPPRVSVIVTTYRTPPQMLCDALDSVLAQTLVDLELIIVADGPLDEPQRSAVDRRVGDPRVRVVDPGRVGRARALNVGIELARAKLIAIQDADDASHVQRLERQVQVFDDRPDIDVLGSGVRRSSSSYADVNWSLPPGRSDVEVLDKKLLVGNPLVHSSVMARRASVQNVGCYAIERRYQFDHDLYLRVRDAGMGVARLADPLVLKRVHAGQVFEGASPVIPRLVSAWRLQVDHARSEPIPQRYAVVGAASVRLGARVARAFLRRIRERR